MSFQTVKFPGSDGLLAYDEQLKCPRCDSKDNLHQGRVTVFDRAEDAGETLVTLVPVSGSAETKRVPSDSSGNPSPRRQALIIEFECECCGGGLELLIMQHKGVTLLLWRFEPAVVEEYWIDDDWVDLTAAEFAKLRAHPLGGDVLQLLEYLVGSVAPDSVFPAPPRTLLFRDAIPGWDDADRYKNALLALRELGLLVLVHRGGSGPGDAHLYQFRSKPTAPVQRDLGDGVVEVDFASRRQAGGDPAA